MEPRVRVREPFAVLGIVIRISRGSETPDLFAGIWRQFESHRPRIEPVAIGKHYFGVNFPTDQEGVTDYGAGMMIRDDTPIPLGLEKRRVPGGQFAVFECPVETIGDGYRYIFTVWLRGAAVDFDPAVPVFEEYPENTAQQPVCIHVPICQRHEEAQVTAAQPTGEPSLSENSA